MEDEQEMGGSLLKMTLTTIMKGSIPMLLIVALFWFFFILYLVGLGIAYLWFLLIRQQITAGKVKGLKDLVPFVVLGYPATALVSYVGMYPLALKFFILESDAQPITFWFAVLYALAIWVKVVLDVRTFLQTADPYTDADQGEGVYFPPKEPVDVSPWQRYFGGGVVESRVENGVERWEAQDYGF